VTKVDPYILVDNLRNSLPEIMIGLTYDPKSNEFMPNAGINLKATKTDRRRALELLNYLEAKRILYDSIPNERVDHSIYSVIEIRNYITDKVIVFKRDTKLTKYCSEFRSACNDFLTITQDFGNLEQLAKTLPPEEWRKFGVAVRHLRRRFAFFLAMIVSAYHISIDERFARIIPGTESHDPWLLAELDETVGWEV